MKFKALEVIDKLGSAEKNQGKCEIFSEIITTELTTLNQKQRFLAKHEIQNVVLIQIQTFF